MEVYFIIQVLVGYLVTCSATVCPNSSKSAVPDFSNEFADMYYVTNGQSIPLYCCAHGYDNITWWRWIGHSWENILPLPDGDYDLEEHQQVLRIFRAQLSDNTTFRCQLVKNGINVKERVLWLLVVACDPLARGPLLIPPFPQNYTIDHFGEKTVLSCTGYFGCNEQELKIVWWSMKGSGKNLMKISPRYNVSTTESPDRTVKMSTFTITSVQREDLDRTFFCTVGSDQITEGQTVTVVKLLKNERPNLVFIISSSVGSVLGAVVLTLLHVQCIAKLYGPQIRLFINSRFPGLAPKPVTVQGQMDFKHNAFIFHAEDDQAKAEDLRNQLMEFDYDVFICGDVTGNQAKQSTYQDECCRSAMILFLYTDNLQTDPFVKFLLHGLIEFRGGKGIMFLEVSKYEPQTILEWTRQGRNIANDATDENGHSIEDLDNNTNTVDTVNNAANEYSTLIDGDADNIAGIGNATQIEQSGIDDDIKFWKALPRLKVPLEGASQRQKKNFLAALQNKIPRLRYEIECDTTCNVHNSTCGRPLLMPSPTSALTLNSDNVFTFPSSDIEHNPVCDANINVHVVVAEVAQNINVPTDENRSVPIIVDMESGRHDANIIQGTSNNEQSNSFSASSSIGCNNLPLNQEISVANESGYAGSSQNEELFSSSSENEGTSPLTVGSDTSGFSGDDRGFLMSGLAPNNHQTSGIRCTEQQITNCDDDLSSDTQLCQIKLE